MTALETANQEQRRASNPNISAFVAASAGTGKTKLLTDRLLRLMLTGTAPHKILCLTYTKAAAAEMAIRLNRRLGEWVVLPNDALNKELAKLDVPQTESIRTNARKLFADVLDLPGGMKISTIHAFCQSLLRRFPLEAQISPHFEVEDETAAMHRLREAREDTLSNPQQRDSIFALAEDTDETSFAELVGKFAVGHQLQILLRHFPVGDLTAMQRAALHAPDKSLEEIMRRATAIPGETKLRQALLRIAEAGNPSGIKWAQRGLDWLSNENRGRLEKWEDWIDIHFTSAAKPRSLNNYFGSKLALERDDLSTTIEAEQGRIEQIEDSKRALKLAALNAHLLALVSPILQRDQTQKAEQTILSYGDLIAITLRLLQQPDDVAWILYKLDGGIDHLLLDEVQDTAPAQWQIADAIAGEFFAGAGAREAKRSIFAVGDAKQSIFSFQGADLKSFELYQSKFRQKAEAAGQDWLDGKLSVSFRSTAPVLQLVDTVFADPAACEGVCAPGSLNHGVSRTGQAGRITLWPLTKPAMPTALPAWDVPDDYASHESGKAALAKQIAEHIQGTLRAGTRLPSRGRHVRPGDFLILVRQRDEFVTALTRACKKIGVPIAGLDRMVLTDQQAVSDLLALCDALLLPSDDLAFAQFLASPLGGLTDASLMRLAMNRPSTLAAALYARRDEQADWAAADAYFQALRQKVDFISPYEVLAFALGPLGGRAKLLERLGPDAAEPIDEVLAEAQAHARQSAMSLQNFVFLLRQSGASIKREAEAGGDVVRIMTVHGAKGLQAPIVILPDTASLPKTNDTLFQLEVPGHPITVPIFCPRKDLRSGALTTAVSRNNAEKMAEYNRLLYVALTRAEDELIVCGAEPKQKLPSACWYQLVLTGFQKLPVQPDEAGRYELACPQTADPDRQDNRTATSDSQIPAWAGHAPAWRAVPPAAEATKPEPLAPSRSSETPTNRTIPASPITHETNALRGTRAAALAKGRTVHALLQHLPDLPAAQRQAAAAQYLAQPGLGLPAAMQSQILQSVMGIVGDPKLQPLFGPGSKAEVPLAGVLNEIEIGGLVDRLAVTGSEVIIADYKTDRIPPTGVNEVPAAYLRQLAAYQALLGEIFPAKPIICLLIWTETAHVMTLPPDLIARYAPALGQPY